MNCIIEGIDFYELEAQKYYSTPANWSDERKKENAMNKIFSNNWEGALKRDGIFVMTGRNPDGEIFLRPRARNVKKEFVNKVDWVPHLHSFLNDIDPGTVFLGELYLPRNEQAKSSSSIMNSLQAKAIKKQEKEEDKLHLYIFDVLAENNRSYLEWKATDRFDLLNSFSRAYPNQYIEWAEYFEGKELWDKLQEFLADGREGMVITRKDAPYTPGSRKQIYTLKIKKEIQETIDCVIIGANPPTKLSGTKEPETWEWWFDERKNIKMTATEYKQQYGKPIYSLYFDGAQISPVTKAWYYGWAGSLKLGLYKDEVMVHVGDLSGISDEMKENWKNYINTVVEISCMELSSNEQGGRGFRHPKLIATRQDLDPRECTYERVFGN